MSGTTKKKRRFKQIRLHLFRVLMFVMTLVLIRSTHVQFLNGLKSDSTPIDLEVANQYFPQGAELLPSAVFDDAWAVVTVERKPLGYLLETSPHSDAIIGFSGPTNCLIVLTNQFSILDIQVISSGDTEEHLNEVLRHPKFLSSFADTPVKEVNELKIDAISGATLTSLAIAQTIQFRLGKQTSFSLKFPERIHLETVRQMFPNAMQLIPADGVPSAWYVKDSTGKKIGTVLRSSPAADNTVGYQGPSDFVIGLDDQNKFQNLTILSSYDNQPYVRYVKEDAAFGKMHAGKTIEQLSEIDTDNSDYEGVSGATMTSQAIIAGTQLTVAAFLANQKSQAPTIWNSEFQMRDLGTILIVISGIIIAFSKLRGSRILRLIFQLMLIVYLGLINGEMFSQALLTGWSQTRIPWSTATGLVVLSCAALIVPICSRRNVYCSHVCPHGALQELIKGRVGFQINLSSTWRQFLKVIPGILVSWCLLVAILHLPFSVVDIEPFNAWVFQIAGWATLTVAALGLVAALFIPMAYCKYGCPTGAILSFLRFNSRSDRWNRADSLACSLLLFALGVRVFM